MSLEEHLKPSEEVHYRSDGRVEYGENKYNVYLTNDRFILYAERGLIRNKDDMLTWNLGNILRINYKEEGLIRTKGIMNLETENDTKIPLKGKVGDMKTIYQNCMQFVE